MNNLSHLNDADRAELEQIKNAIIAAVPCQKIYLFGSYAYGTPHKESDFDIYAVLADEEMRQIDAMIKLRYAIRPVKKHAIDLIAQKPSIFERRKNYVTSIEKDVSAKGVLIYG